MLTLSHMHIAVHHDIYRQHDQSGSFSSPGSCFCGTGLSLLWVATDQAECKDPDLLHMGYIQLEPVFCIHSFIYHHVRTLLYALQCAEMLLHISVCTVSHSLSFIPCVVIPVWLFLCGYSCMVIPVWLFLCGYSCVVIPV